VSKNKLPGQWHVDKGTDRFALGKPAGDLVLTADTQLTERLFGR
jgi:hypothetical protein